MKYNKTKTQKPHLRKFFFIGLAALFYTAGHPPGAMAAPNSLKIKISWQYEGVPPGIKIYEIKKNAETGLWDTDNVKSLQKTPAGKELKNGEFMITPGKKKEFVLVYHNKKDEAIHFFAAPHHMNPEKNSLGYKFKCLCVNHIFTAEPGHYWYRVVDLRSTASIEGDTLDISHTLIRVDNERHKKYYEKRGFSF